jgi:hypothetical protein
MQWARNGFQNIQVHSEPWTNSHFWILLMYLYPMISVGPGLEASLKQKRRWNQHHRHGRLLPCFTVTNAIYEIPF